MTRGVTTLEAMVENLRFETRRSNNTNIGQDEFASLKYLITRTQFWLFWDFDWQFLKVRRDLTMAQDQRFYDFPADLDFERITRIRGDGNTFWKPIVRGIGMEEYNVFDSDDGVQSFPARNWDIIDVGSGEQIEIWPLPSQDGELIRFEGFKVLGPLLSNNAVCTLDDTLIVLFAAAHLLVGQDNKLAETTLAEANKMYLRMRGGSQRREGGSFVMGGDLRKFNRDPFGATNILAVSDPS